MVQLQIHVDLLPDKLNEFMQSWESFSLHVKNNEGLVSYTMKPTGKSAFNIELNCSGSKQLKQLQKDIWYEFLLGAIETLGDKSYTKENQFDIHTNNK